MKYLLVLTNFVVLFAAIECTSQPCTCWPDYEISTTDGKGACIGKLTHRIVDCNEPDIPQCECTKDGKVVKQLLGITDCASINGNKDCDNAAAFEGYFQRHPERRIYN